MIARSVTGGGIKGGVMQQLKQVEINGWRFFLISILAFGNAGMSGCAVLHADDKRDPLEPLNRGIYQVNEALDEIIIDPVSRLYKAILPEPVDKGITNAFGNIRDVVVIANDILQFKFAQALSDIGRVVVNSTLGLGGLIDVATRMELEKHNEDFGQTLGYWGFGDGPYLVLPLLGPSSLRDGIGLLADTFVDPLFYIQDISIRNSLLGLKYVDIRSDLLSTGRIVEEAALDEYTFTRDAYLQRRNSQVHDGEPQAEVDDR